MKFIEIDGNYGEEIDWNMLREIDRNYGERNRLKFIEMIWSEI